MPCPRAQRARQAGPNPGWRASSSRRHVAQSSSCDSTRCIPVDSMVSCDCSNANSSSRRKRPACASSATSAIWMTRTDSCGCVVLPTCRAGLARSRRSMAGRYGRRSATQRMPISSIPTTCCCCIRCTRRPASCSTTCNAHHQARSRATVSLWSPFISSSRPPRRHSANSFERGCSQRSRKPALSLPRSSKPRSQPIRFRDCRCVPANPCSCGSPTLGTARSATQQKPNWHIRRTGANPSGRNSRSSWPARRRCCGSCPSALALARRRWTLTRRCAGALGCQDSRATARHCRHAGRVVC